jgi:hypothetical protein
MRKKGGNYAQKFYTAFKSGTSRRGQSTAAIHVFSLSL